MMLSIYLFPSCVSCSCVILSGGPDRKVMFLYLNRCVCAKQSHIIVSRLLEETWSVDLYSPEPIPPHVCINPRYSSSSWGSVSALLRRPHE